DLKGLYKVIKRADGCGVECAGCRTAARHKHDTGLRLLGRKTAKHFVAVSLAENNVGKDQLEAMFADEIKRLLGRRSGSYGPILIIKNIRNKVSYLGFVVDDKCIRGMPHTR